MEIVFGMGHEYYIEDFGWQAFARASARSKHLRRNASRQKSLQKTHDAATEACAPTAKMGDFLRLKRGRIADAAQFFFSRCFGPEADLAR